MTRRPLHRPDGVQLGLPLDTVDAESEIARWGAECELRIELELFTKRLIEFQGYQASSATTHRKLIGAMVRESGRGTMGALCNDPPALAEAIARPEHRPYRRQLHLATQDFLRLLESELTPTVAEKCRAAIDAGFGGRTVPLPHLVDRELGGSVKEVRLRPPLDWADGDRIIDAIDDECSTYPARDRAMLAVLLRSGQTPGEAVELDWEFVLPLFGSDVEIGYILIEARMGEKRLAIHETARVALAELWRAEGEPITGPVFVSSRQPRSRLSTNHVSDIVREVVVHAGYPPIDRRQLRVPFARWLREVRGWSRLATAAALGLREVRRKSVV